MTKKHIKSLYVFDIDDTLFQTTARAKVTNSEGKVKYLNSQELKDFECKYDKKISYDEFRSTKKFIEESRPLHPILKIAQRCINETVFGSQTILLTARADLDCKRKFLEYLSSSGLDMSKTYVERAGNLSHLRTPEAKKLIIRNYLKLDHYDEAWLFDDSLKNINSFKELRKIFPKTNFFSRLIIGDLEQVSFAN